MGNEDRVRAPPRTLNTVRAIIICNIMMMMMTIACRHRHHRNLTSWPFIWCVRRRVLNMMMHHNLRASMDRIWSIKLNLFEPAPAQITSATFNANHFENQFDFDANTLSTAFLQTTTHDFRQMHLCISLSVKGAAYIWYDLFADIQTQSQCRFISEFPSSQQIVCISIDTDIHLELFFFAKKKSMRFQAVCYIIIVHFERILCTANKNAFFD